MISTQEKHYLSKYEFLDTLNTFINTEHVLKITVKSEQLLISKVIHGGNQVIHVKIDSQEPILIGKININNNVITTDYFDKRDDNFVLNYLENGKDINPVESLTQVIISMIDYYHGY